ncbi:hypothetical protein DPMN_109350 [Dreissena polymorpha]|uniref:Uncharacterized protein n=1 Tax=Dreissena polymorpha TaxID=45954 RepID=A0A9D4QLV5_DREPO|nr:hypothetical protein DPMN_109350 [Dreissena polymorpha]
MNCKQRVTTCLQQQGWIVRRRESPVCKTGMHSKEKVTTYALSGEGNQLFGTTGMHCKER